MGVNVLDSHDQQWRLAERIGQGAEGAVFTVAGHPTLVAKLVPRPDDPDAYRQRIERLVRQRHEPRTVRLLSGAPADSGTVAWPWVAVRTATGVHGYLMTDLRHDFSPFDTLLSPSGADHPASGPTWATALTAAAGLAALLAAMHDEGYLVGDLKPDNLWVDGSGRVAIADVDSWQFTDRGRLFPSRMRSPGYTAPERVDTPDALATRAADDFVLALLVHQLLLAGLHPFAGAPADGSEYRSIDDNIVNGRCNLTDRQSTLIPSALPPIDLLPDSVRQLLRAALGAQGRAVPESRPGADTWARVLAGESTDGRLRRCPGNDWHVYTVERPWCPWCDLAERGRPVYPAGPADHRSPPDPPKSATNSPRQNRSRR